jgi:hypothetical protein
MSKPPKMNLKSFIVGDDAEPQPDPPPMAVATPPAVEAPPSVPVGAFQPPTERAPRRAVTKKAGQGTLRERSKQQSLYLEEPVYEQLRELAFHERKAMHGLILEGLDLLFKKRGLKSLSQLAKQANG